jgi:oligopeptide/dipeptide ABC transporter ATP-binding protein
MKSLLAPLRRSPLAVTSAILVLALLVLAVVAPLLWGEQASAGNPDEIFVSPSPAHILGTDAQGRDVFLRVLVATRLSLQMALLATGLGAIVGLAIGAVPAVLGRRTQRAFGAVINVWLAFPVLLVAMLTVVLLGASMQTAVIALALTMTPSFARLAQTLSSRVGGSEYLAAARLLGVPLRHQLTRYVLPNIAEPVIVNVTISIGGGLLALSSLSFLGIGVQPPEYDWGRLLSEGFDQVYSSPAAAIGPGLAVVVAGVAFGTLGEAFASHLRDQGSPSVRLSRLGDVPRPGADAAPPARAVSSTPALLEVRGLSVSFPASDAWVQPVRDISFSVSPGEIIGVVGESGSGKSLTMMAIAGLADPDAVVQADSIRFEGHELADRRRKGPVDGIGVVFQDSLTALNPAMRVGPQIAEVLRRAGVSRADANSRAIAALEAVGILDAEVVAHRFPHELSGGMRQRALIAMAQIGDPRLIIADEPTTALDVTIQRRVLTQLRRRCDETGAAAIVVSHDIAVLSELCQRILVVYAGRVVEEVDVALLATPELLEHPYTRALAASLPDLDTDLHQPLANIPGDPPDPSTPVAGCAFAPRCPFATERCRTVVPVTAPTPAGSVACWHPQGGTALVLDREATTHG